MIRLPPTGIAISQNDLHNQTQHLDTYAGLLKQGFRKATDSPSPFLELPPSTYDLISQSDKLESYGGPAMRDKEVVEEIQHQFASPVPSPPQSEVAHETQAESRSMSLEVDPVPTRRMHAPRQSSLLRFARRLSSETSDSEQHVTSLFAQRPSVTYRSRSETYSYDQSEMDEDTTTTADYKTPVDELQSLSLYDDDLTTISNSTNATSQVVSTLRPDAMPFVPSSGQLIHRSDASQNIVQSPSSNTDSSSLPSSPPVAMQVPANVGQNPPSPVALPRTPPLPRRDTSPIAYMTQTQQRSLDGSFSVYNDSLPAIIQPQTPADLSRIRHLTEYSAAFTAPPGMVRSNIARQGAGGQRQASGELSPARRAATIRERRQREFVRGLRVEGQRIDRLRSDTRDSIAHQRAHIDTTGFWRDDLDADSVGEENFEEASFAVPSRGIRTISGNRRAI